MTRVHQNKLISVIINASSWCQHRDLWLTDSVVKPIVTKKDHLKNCRGSIKLTKVIDLNSIAYKGIVLTEPDLQSFQRLRLKYC